MATPQAKKGNKTTEIIVGAGAVKLTGAVSMLNAVVEVINQLPSKVEENIILVSDLEDKIGGLKQDLTNQVAQNKIEIQQAYEANKEEFFNKHLDAKKLVAIPATELKQIQTQLTDATENVDKAVAAAVQSATNSLKSVHENEKKIANLEHEKKEAANVAEINQLKQQNAFLETQIKNMQNLLDNQMKNETERAKYAQISTLNVGGTTQGR